MTEGKDPVAQFMTEAAERIAMEIRPMLAGLGVQVQGAILADLVSMWLAGIWEPSELRARKSGAGTQVIRLNMFEDWCKLVYQLLPESERELLDRNLQELNPGGHA